MASESSDADRFFRIFHPHAHDEVHRVKNSNVSFVHYTSAEAALSIIEKREVWMRKSSCMADFSEVTYGMNCLEEACRSDAGKQLHAMLERMFVGFSDNFNPIYARLSPLFEEGTYLTCVSEHDPVNEHDIGRLSMWRAFGAGARVALVFNKSAFFGNSDVLRVYASPVAYVRLRGFIDKFEVMVRAIEENFGFLQAQGQQDIANRLFNAFRFAALCTKHPGFHEEREWRCIYSPQMNRSEVVKEGRHIFGGVPQPIYKIPLEDVPERGLTGVAIPTLLERVIIGPTPYPHAVFETFERALSDAGVPDARAKVRISDIPLRQS